MDIDLHRKRVLSSSLISEGTTYPQQVDPNEIDWSLEPYTAPTGGIPDYLSPVNDATTGAEIIRIADQDAFGVTDNRVGHAYSSNAVWNCDETLIKLNTPSARILDASNYSVQYIASAPSYSQWSNSDPLKMYGTQSGNEFVIFDLETDQRTTLHTFINTENATAYTNISIGSGEGRLSDDDRYVVLTADNSGSTWLISYDILTDTVIAELELPSGDLDFATISGTGDYIIVSWRTDGSGINQGLKLYDRDLTNLRHVLNYTGHGDCGTSIQGNEVFVQFRSSEQSLGVTQRYLEMIKLSDGTVYGLYYDTDTPTPRGVWGGHVSCRNLDRPGFAYISEGGSSDDVMAYEIFSIKLDEGGENTVERYGKHHSARLNGHPNESNAYQHEAQGTVNRDGTKIIFNSNWNDTTVKTWEAAPTFVLNWLQTNGMRSGFSNYRNSQNINLI